jgi:hypothetical protein
MPISIYSVILIQHDNPCRLAHLIIMALLYPQNEFVPTVVHDAISPLRENIHFKHAQLLFTLCSILPAGLNKSTNE